MMLEDLIYKRLTENIELTNLLAKFNKNPAIFYQSAPGDQSDGWNKKKQYPRIDYIVDMQANPERQTSGFMALNIWCSEEDIHPEDIEPIVRNTFNDIFMTPEGCPPYCLSWARSDSFEMKSNMTKGTNVIGITLAFDIIAFPNQGTTDPDPILATNQFIKELIPNSIIIGLDEMPDILITEINKPVFYFRLVNLSLERETNTVAWMRANLVGHVFAPTTNIRLKWLKYIVDVLAYKGEIIMLDNSPLLLKSIKADSTANHIISGQLQVNVSFGILRRTDYAHTLLKTNIPREIIETENTDVNISNNISLGYKVEYHLAGEDE